MPQVQQVVQLEQVVLIVQHWLNIVEIVTRVIRVAIVLQIVVGQVM
jgi:hypothetical protein